MTPNPPSNGNGNGNSPLATIQGLTRAAKNRRPRVVWSIEAFGKCGKTHLAFSAPEPIVYWNIDRGEEGTIEKFLDQGKEIYQYDIPMTRDMLAGTPEQVMRKCEPELRKFLASFDAVTKTIGHPRGPKTLIIDTFGDLFTLGCLALIGKNEKIMPMERTRVNSLFAGLVREAFYYDANLLLLHKLTEWDGKVKPSGFNQVEFLVQAIVRCEKKVKKTVGGGSEHSFVYTIQNCRHNTELEGESYDSKRYGFAELASEIIDGTSPDDWR